MKVLNLLLKYAPTVAELKIKTTAPTLMPKVGIEE